MEKTYVTANVIACLNKLYPRAVFDDTFIARDENDGKGPYIAEWNSSDPFPTNEQIEAVLAAADLARIDDARSVAYKTEADPLFFKAQRGEAEKEDWLKKIAEIKLRIPKNVKP